MKTLEQSRLKELLSYNQISGEFVRRHKIRGYRVGDIAGAFHKDGYRQIMIDGLRHMAHRLAWLYVYGYLPKEFIDHINGIRDDNRIENLRESSKAENQQNLRKARANNKTGLLGVTKSGKKYMAAIKTKGQAVYLGTYESPELAHDAYLNAKRNKHPFNTL